MKAIIPVAGAGAKLRPLTYTQPKPLIPVAGKPILAFIIDQYVAAGVTDFVFILGYLGEKIRHYVETRYPRIRKEFVYQEPREGTAHAIWQAKDLLYNSDEIIIQFGDTIVDLDMPSFISKPGTLLGVMRVDNPQAFGVVEFGDDMAVHRIVEKPKIPKSNWALVGLYRISEVKTLVKAMDYLITQDLRTQGEFQLTDALVHIIEQGVDVRAYEVDNWWDCGQKDQLLRTNALLLEKQEAQGTDHFEMERSILIPPVSIGNGCVIRDAIVGPHVTIGESARIHRSVIWNSIIGNYSALDETVLKQSVIGNDALIKGLSQSLNIGDNADIDLSQ